ncbi:MAG: hypothetical protein J6T37_04905 [Bacteroidales bacterium]|nr:hypothetical protein [Bacteroidales bacterium]
MLKNIRFKDGSCYEGEVNEAGEPHGRGYMNSPSDTGSGRRDRYEGEFKNGKKDGFGYMSYELNGYVAEYEGEWRDDKRCGLGKYTKYSMGGGASHSYTYEGEWLDDKEHGYGMSVNSDQRGLHLSTVSEKYEGGFKEGKRHGHGKITKDGYDGNFAKGKEYFEGEFEDGRLVGPCVHTMVNGDVCEFPEGYLNGIGNYTFANGVKFTALWQKGDLDFDTIELEGGKKALFLMVSEGHNGFGYSEAVRCLLIAQKGKLQYNKGVILYNGDFHINAEGAYLEVTDVTDDSVTYVVKSCFLSNGGPIKETIKRGETKKYKDEVEHTGRMYDDDFTYTSGSELLVSCK